MPHADALGVLDGNLDLPTRAAIARNRSVDFGA